MINILNIDKRKRFFFYTVFTGVYLYAVSTVDYFSTIQVISITGVVVLLNSLVAHYPNLEIKNLVFPLILPFSLLIGGYLFLIKFPNFTTVFKLVAIIGFSFLYYLILLSDNIFLVVSDKEEIIPLYRVASTWSQILGSLVSIPLFAGLFKITSNSYYHAFASGIIGVLFCSYQIWTLKYDSDAKRVGVEERILLCTLVLFFLFSSTICLSFLPTEAFLRGLVAAAVLMFSLTYVQAHLKNSITKKLLFQNFFIIVFFVLMALIFRN